MRGLSEDKLSGGLQLKYLEKLVERIFRPEPGAFESNAAAHVYSIAYISKSTTKVDFTDTYELFR